MNKGKDHKEEIIATRLTSKQQKLIESAIAEIISSNGSFDVIEEEAIKVASLAGRLQGSAREAAVEQLVVACTRVNKPRKVIEPLIAEAFAVGDSLIKKPGD